MKLTGSVLLPFLLFTCSIAVSQSPDTIPGNLAPAAEITASSEFSGAYRATFVADGRVPAENAQDDAGYAWCVSGATAGDSGQIDFTWNAPVVVAEIVYYGRTGWFRNECWKDFAVYADEPLAPIQTGALAMVHGHQRITLGKPVTLQRLTLNFTSSYGGANPGASEIQIFSEPPSDEMLAEFMRKQAMRDIPSLDQVNKPALENLIGLLGWEYGPNYRQQADHRARLATGGQDLARLQRDVLLFDVDRLLVIKRHEIVASHVYTYHYEGFRAGGGLYVLSVSDTESPPIELAASPDGQILDCDLSYDGNTVLFSWRTREDEGYHLWTVNIDGSDLRQLTDGAWHDYNGCWLPDGGIAFLSTRAPQFAYCWHAPVGVLHRMNADGTGVRRLSANYLNDFTPYVLDDGRIVYTRWEYVDRPAIPIQSLWTINPDGTRLAGFFGNRVISPGTFMEARSIPGTTRVVCTMTGHNGPTRGAIGVIDRALGVNAQAAITNLTPDTPVPGVGEGNGNTEGSKLYSSPMPLDRHRLLLSARGPAIVRTFTGDCVATVLPTPLNGMQYFCAQPVRPRPRPPSVPSTLPQAANESKATVYVQDIYNGLEPYVARGKVKRLRVVREMEKAVRIDPSLRAFGFQFPVISCGATYAAKDVVGEVPVAPNGTAHFRVPAGAPIYFMVLDEFGRAVQRMRSFTHFMPGEVQGCIGCHEERRHTPQTFKRPVYEGEPQDLEPPEWGRGGFSYADVVQPVLDRYCISCHSGLTPDGGLDLCGDKTDYFNVSYEVLARENQGPKGSPYVSWIPTYNGQEQNILEVRPSHWGSPCSLLARLIMDGHPDAEGKPRFDMDDTSRRRIFAWIDLNVPYYHTSETAYPEREGCRRLYPETLDATLAEVAARRCLSCHEHGVPRKEWVRITQPQLNGFLAAPLAKSGGGAGTCGTDVFLDTNDPDYQAVLRTFAPMQEMLAARPRMDMPGARPAPEVCRDRK